MSKMSKRINHESRKNTSQRTEATLVLFAVSSLLCVGVVSQTDAQTVPSSNSYTNSAGTYHVVGEVANNSTTAIHAVIVAGTFYDTDNRVVATGFAATLPFNIQPGQKSPFDMMVFDEGQVKNIYNYTLQVNHRD